MKLSDITEVPLYYVATNIPTKITRSGVEGKSWYITYMNWRVSGSAPVGVSNLPITLKDGDTTIYVSAIPAKAVNGTNLQIALGYPIKITEGNSFTFEIASPNNPGCIIYTNIGATLR